MGNIETRAEISIESEADTSIFNKKAPQFKIVCLNFANLERKMEFELSLNNISFESFSKEFEKAINLPDDCQSSYYTINSITGSSEIIENDYVICNINKEIIFEIKNRGSRARIIDISLTIIDDQKYTCQNIKSFNFMTLKQTLMFLKEKKKVYRVFESEDTSLEKPLDLDLNLDDLKLCEDEIILVVYLINPKDIIKVVISDETETVKLDVDKYMRISELTETYNNECRKFNLLCDPSTSLKLFEQKTIEELRNEKKSINFIGQSFDTYYKRSFEAPKINPLEEENIKTNFLDIPD